MIDTHERQVRVRASLTLNEITDRAIGWSVSCSEGVGSKGSSRDEYDPMEALTALCHLSNALLRSWGETR